MKRLLSVAAAFTVGVLPLTTTLIQPEPASAYHKTNKWKRRKALKRGGWTVIYSEEFSQKDWFKLSSALAADYFGGSGAFTTAFVADFGERSYSTFLHNLQNKSPEAQRQIRKAFNQKNFTRLIHNALKTGRVQSKNLPGIRIKAGKDTYNRAECVSVFGNERCLPSPNTHQPYVAFKILKGDTRRSGRPSKKSPYIRKVRACNHTSVSVYAAYAIANNNKGMRVSGWRKIGPRKCQTLATNVNGANLYFRGESADGNKIWGTDIKICAHPTKSFSTRFAVRNCHLHLEF